MAIFINDVYLDNFIFPGGECHIKIWKLEIKDQTRILAKLENSDDIMCLLLAVDAVRRVNPHTEIDLVIPYFPYARQDRMCNEGEALSIKVMADLVNSLECHNVTIYDPHSDVTSALLKNCTTISLAEIVDRTGLAQQIIAENLILVSPDAGASKKIKSVVRMLSVLGFVAEDICASKTRDLLTGNISSMKCYGDIKGKNLIIIDDICDGGRTFIELAKLLKEAGAGDVYLYVTHGIFSQGLDALQQYFKHIYCYHSMLAKDQNHAAYLTIFSLL